MTEDTNNEQSIDIDRVAVEAHESYATLLWYKDALEDAKAHYKRAIEIDPEHTRAHHNYVDLLQYEQARVHRRWDVMAVHHYNTTSFQHHEADEPEQAKYNYEQALAIDPDFTAVRENYETLCDTM